MFLVITVLLGILVLSAVMILMVMLLVTDVVLITVVKAGLLFCISGNVNSDDVVGVIGGGFGVDGGVVHRCLL